MGGGRGGGKVLCMGPCRTNVWACEVRVYRSHAWPFNCFLICCKLYTRGGCERQKFRWTTVWYIHIIQKDNNNNWLGGVRVVVLTEYLAVFIFQIELRIKCFYTHLCIYRYLVPGSGIHLAFNLCSHAKLQDSSYLTKTPHDNHSSTFIHFFFFWYLVCLLDWPGMFASCHKQNSPTWSNTQTSFLTSLSSSFLTLSQLADLKVLAV